MIITVTSDCVSTTFVDRAFNDMTIHLGQSTSQGITFQDTKEVALGWPGYCGPRTVTISGGTPGYLSLDAGFTTFTLATNDVTHSGVHSVTF